MKDFPQRTLSSPFMCKNITDVLRGVDMRLHNADFFVSTEKKWEKSEKETEKKKEKVGAVFPQQKERGGGEKKKKVFEMTKIFIGLALYFSERKKGPLL
ncbi:hypothetical protein CDAR_25511 [Caerostris darwini]|uniref:Uncharacterized protein n=1 Tax=Caerostris darwini TaxID=1538125 RepID=A0AAV4TZP9_9ARAC|nr:hypothetical protein CDAR_25511 [Caerostris darwini]